MRPQASEPKDTVTVLLLMEQVLTAGALATVFRRGGYAVEVLDIRVVSAGLLPREQQYDVVVFDADFAASRASKRLWSVLDRWPGRLLAVSERAGEALAHGPVARRAAGRVHLDVSLDELQKAVAAVASGRRYVSRQPEGASVASAAAVPPVAAGSRGALTVREADVLERLARGDATTQIARDLGISLNTARTHVQNVLAKLGVHSRLEAVATLDPRGIGGQPPA